jgi:hypothetical protein
MARRPLRSVILLHALALVACAGGPTGPLVRGATLLLPAQVAGTIVRCDFCTDPAIWAVVEAPVTITNVGNRGLRVASVEARVVNHTRLSVIASNTRPNVDISYPDTDVPANGSLTLEAAVVYHPLPPPRDEIWLVVIVSFEDGTSADARARLFTDPS